MGPERTPWALLAPSPVLSPSCITLENNRKIRPQPDWENAFARVSGGDEVRMSGVHSWSDAYVRVRLAL